MQVILSVQNGEARFLLFDIIFLLVFVVKRYLERSPFVSKQRFIFFLFVEEDILVVVDFHPQGELIG